MQSKGLSRVSPTPQFKSINSSALSFLTSHLNTHSGSLPQIRNKLFSSVTQSCPTLCDPLDCSIPGFPVHHQLPELAQTQVHQVSDIIQPFHLLSSPSPPAFNPSQHQGLFNESILHNWWPKYWSFSFSIRPSNEYSGLISFRIDCFDLLAVQGTLKQSSPTPQFKSINILVLRFLYNSTLTSTHDGKTIALTRWTFISKVMSLFFNMLYRFGIAFLPRSKCLLISWLQSLSAVILEPKKIVCHCFHCFPIYLPCSGGTGCHGLHFLNAKYKPAFSPSSFTFIKKLFCTSSFSTIKVVSSAYLRLLIFLPAILIPACASSSPAFCMMYSAYKLNKWGDNV